MASKNCPIGYNKPPFNYKMPAATWIAHVKSVYSKGGMTYKQAMQRAAKTWKKKKSGAAAPVRKSRGKRKSKAKEPEDEKEPEEEEEKDAPKRKRKRARAGAGKFEKNIN